MLTRKTHKPSCKIWIEYNGKPLLGRGGAEILDQIGEEESISRAAKNLNMSYRYVWGYLQRIEKAIGEPIVQAYRGGKSGGGGAKLTRLGKSILTEYRQLEAYLGALLSETKYREVTKPKINATNRLKGKVVAVEKDGLMAKVRVEVTVPTIVTVVIPKEAVKELDIKTGDQVEAMIEATEVLIGK